MKHVRKLVVVCDLRMEGTEPCGCSGEKDQEGMSFTSSDHPDASVLGDGGGDGRLSLWQKWVEASTPGWLSEKWILPKPGTPAVTPPRQENHEFKAGLGYFIRPLSKHYHAYIHEIKIKKASESENVIRVGNGIYSLGFLSPAEQRTTVQGQVYFLHTQTGVSTWHDPRIPR